MKIYLAGLSKKMLDHFPEVKILLSYLDKSSLKHLFANHQHELFLDSGAYSAWSRGIFIDIKRYGEFIQENRDHLTTYANLDVIGDPQKTEKNQTYLEDVGLEPLPTYHYGEPHQFLKKLIDKYKYIAFGGMVPIPSIKLKAWLDNLWRELTDDKGAPTIQVHGFGLTEPELIERYPWYSVDSTSWLMTGIFGGILTPYGKISFSRVADKPDHYLKNPPEIRKIIDEYLAKYGFTPDDCYDDHARNILNIHFFLNLEKQVTKKQPRFNKSQQQLFNVFNT